MSKKYRSITRYRYLGTVPCQNYCSTLDSNVDSPGSHLPMEKILHRKICSMEVNHNIYVLLHKVALKHFWGYKGTVSQNLVGYCYFLFESRWFPALANST